MGAPDILGQLTAAGLRLATDGDHLVVTPRDRLTDDLRQLIRANKPALIEALTVGDAPLDPLAAAALAKLVIDEAMRRAIVAEPTGEADKYRVGVALRMDDGGYATVVLSVPKSDGFDLLEVLQKVQQMEVANG